MRLDFGIKYGEVLLDIEQGSHLIVEWYSTVFNESEIFRGSYSYAINMKPTEKNLVALGFPNFIANRRSRKSVNVSVLLFGSTWKNAMMDIEVSYERITGTLSIDNGIIAETIRDNLITDMFSYFDGSKKSYEGISMGISEADKRIHMLATASAAPGEYPYAFPSLTNFNIFGVRDLGSTSWVNSFNYADPNVGGYKLLNNNFYNPSFYLVWLIKELCEKLGFQAEGSFLQHPEVRTWIIYNNGYYSGAEIKRQGSLIVIPRHLPKITISSFFKILRNDLKVVIYFDSLTRKATFDFSEDLLLAENTFDFHEQIIDRSPVIKPVADKAFSIVAAIDDGDETYNYLAYTKSVKIGEGTLKKVEMSIGSVFMNNGIFTSDVPTPIRQPQIAQTANIYEDAYSDTTAFNKQGELSVNDFTFRIFTFRGLQQNDEAIPESLLPYGTSDNMNALGVIQPTWLPTFLATEGSVAVFCKMFYQFLVNTESVEFNALVPAHRFFELNPTKLGMIDDVNGSKNRFLIDRISFETSEVGERLFAKVKGYIYHKVFGLVDRLYNTFQINEENIPPDTIYVLVREANARNEPSNGGFRTYAQYEFMFFSDPYLMYPRQVSNLKINYQVYESYHGGDVYTYEYNFTTGNLVYRHLTPETVVRLRWPDGQWKESEVSVREPDNEEYVPIN